jgi:hypothetical protein
MAAITGEKMSDCGSAMLGIPPYWKGFQEAPSPLCQASAMKCR